MKQVVAIFRQLLTEVKDVTQESMDLNPTSFKKRSGFVQTVEWRLNHLFDELKEAINVYDNRWEAIIEDNERWEELMGNYEKRLECWRQLGNDRLLRIEELVERKAELLSEIEMKDEIIRQYRDNLDRFSETIDEKNTKIDSMRRKSAEQSRRIAELTRGV